MSQDILMAHPDGSGRLIPHALYVSLKPQYEASRAASDALRDKHTGTAEARASTRAAFMRQETVDRVEIAAPLGKFVDPSLTDARVNARVNGELNGQANKHGGMDFAVPTPNVYGRPSITPPKFFG